MVKSMSKKEDRDARKEVLRDAVRKIAASASTGRYVSSKGYESDRYGDLTIVTLSEASKK